MISIKKLRASLAVLMIAALVLTPFTSNAAVTGQIPGDNAASISAHESLQVSPEFKIDAEVKNALASEGYVEVLVSMNEKVDTAQVARETQATLSAKTPYQKKMAARYAVVDKLQETAERTQENILNLLETEKKNGKVQQYESFYVVNMVYVKATAEVINKLAMSNEVKKIELSHFNKIDWPEISTAVKDGASVNGNNVQSTEWNINMVGAPSVWQQFSVNGTGVVVGSIDTGVDYTHEALLTKWRGYNAADPSNPNPVGNWFDAVNGQPLPYDEPTIPHGTHVLGTILGQDPDGENIIGVAPGAKFINVKAFTPDGGSDVDLLEAGNWMLAPAGNAALAPDIINNSWGGASGLDEWYREMVQNWRAAGILPVFSAGNQQGSAAPPASVSAPANYPESFAVGAIDINSQRGDFSRRGPSPYAAPDDLKPDIAAPGVNVRSSVPGGYEGGWNGTSMAAPHIVGTAALLLSYNAALTVDQLEAIMTSTATPLTDADYPTSPNYGYGYGCVNAFNAVSSVATGIGTIQGKVLIPGIDSQEAEITHTPIDVVYYGLEPTLTATVSDNIAVGDVELYFKSDDNPYWLVFPMTRISGNYKAGEYSCYIPYELIPMSGSVFQYKIRAYDYGQNMSETETYNVEVRAGLRPDEYTTDFSGYPSGWTLTNEWQWGETTKGGLTAGNKAVATKLSGAYSASTVSSFITPPIDLSNSTTAFLTYDSYIDVENGFDRCYVAVSGDGGQNWSVVNNFTGRDRQWRHLSVDLSAYAGNSAVFVIFQLAPDSSVQYDGWVIDNVSLVSQLPGSSKEIIEPVDPVNPVGLGLDITKNSTPAEFVGTKLRKGSFEGQYYIDNNQINRPTGLPVDAAVTIVETGRTVRTSLQDGSYRITHAASEEGQNWTILVETYGYQPAQEQVQLPRDGVVTKDFLLQELPNGSVSGQVVNERNNQPIAGAKVKVMEDYRVEAVTTDANGYYTLPKVYEGQYTLKFAAANYKPVVLPAAVIGGTNTTVNAQLKPFIGSENEIGYDDGVAENARAFYAAGNGWAVRMTPNGLCQLKGARAYFWDNTWPAPGGNRAAVSVFDSDENGNPRNEIFRTQPFNIIRGQWNDIDLSDYGFATDKDFYLMIVQVDPNPNCPGMGMDETTTEGRSYVYVSGAFSPAEDEGIAGNIMLRANVAYELTTPVITSPENGALTNSDTIEVKGMAGADSLVKIYVNGQVAGEGQTVNKEFAITVPVVDGENTITATSTVASGETDPSAPITVTKDTTLPVLNVTAPEEGFLTNREIIDVAGTTSDEHLLGVKVNDQDVQINPDGSFTHQVISHEGENIIVVEASDRAGNVTRVQRTVNVVIGAPTITDIMPNTDQTVRAGDQVTVSFNSNTVHGQASFRILMNFDSNSNINATGHPMTEVSDGFYQGVWTVPENLNLNGAAIEVRIANQAGTTATAEAAGRITVIMNQEPPTLIPDTTQNAIGQPETITFESRAAWESAITDVLVNGISAAGNYTVASGSITLNGVLFPVGGDYQIVVRANGYSDAYVTQTVQNVTLLNPPTLLPTTINNYFGKSMVISFADDAAWRAAITGITVNGQSIAGRYTVYAGRIIIRASVFPGRGSYNIAISANGYVEATVVQVVR